MERPTTYGLVAPVGELVRQRPHTRQSSPLTPSSRVRTLRAGVYDSAFQGRGMEFDESRAYQPGDDVRAIDWRVTARTGRTHTKLYHEERERPVLLVVDARPMMRFGTRDAFKSVQAARAAATIAWAARDGGDRVGGIVLSASGRTELPPGHSHGRLLAFLRALSSATADTATTPGPRLADALARLERVARPGTSVFVVSDFSDLDAGAERVLARLARRADLGCVLVYDQLETTAPDGTDCRISDGERVLALAGYDRRWRQAYGERFAARRARLETICRMPRATLVPLATGDDPATVLRARLRKRVAA